MKSIKEGDYVFFIEHPYETESEGIVFEVVDESSAKVAAIDGKDVLVFKSDITYVKNSN